MPCRSLVLCSLDLCVPGKERLGGPPSIPAWQADPRCVFPGEWYVSPLPHGSYPVAGSLLLSS